MNDLELAEEIERNGLRDFSVWIKDQIIAALRRGPEPDQTYIVDGKGMRLCDCPTHESKCQRGFQRTLATTEFSRCLLPIDHRQFNWFRSRFSKRPPSSEMVMVPRELLDDLRRYGALRPITGVVYNQPHSLCLERLELLLSAAEASKEAK